MAAPMVHVENDDSSGSEAVPDGFSDGSDVSEELVSRENTEGDSDEETNASATGLGNVISKILHNDSSGSEAVPDEFSDGSDVSEELVSRETTEGDSDEETNASATGLGNVISKILHKNIAAKCSVLSKGLTDRQIHKKRKLKQADEAEASSEKKSRNDDSSDESSASEDDSSDDSSDEKSGFKIDPLRVKPDPLNKEHEKLMQKIATKGVVYLFNAVQKQQKTIEEKLKVAGGSEVKRGRTLKKLTKGGFMDMLKQNEKNTKSDSLITDNEPSWKILRDDFMMGAKMKDWDKESDDGGASDG